MWPYLPNVRVISDVTEAVDRQRELGRLLHREILDASEDFAAVASRRSQWPSAEGVSTATLRPSM